MAYVRSRNGGYEPGGYALGSEPSPEPTDPQLALTGADVVGYVRQQLEVQGRPVAPTQEQQYVAEEYAQMMLAALRAAPAGDSSR